MWVILKSQNYGPLLAIDNITSSNIWRYKNGTQILGTTHVYTPQKPRISVYPDPLRYVVHSWVRCGFLVGIRDQGLGYLAGRGDLISRLIMGITRVIMWVIGVINLLTKPPGPSK